jgi:broad-specificity NMP kinase
MLSLNSGKKVAIVSDIIYDEDDKEQKHPIGYGDLHGQNIYVKEEKDRNDDDERYLDEDDIFEILDDDDFNINKYKRLPMRDRQKLVKALKQKIEPLDDYLVSKYQNMSSKLNDKVNKELELVTGTMIPVPNEDPERVFITGKSGCGKSTIACKYAKEYLKMFPKRKVYIFTKHIDEKEYKTLKYFEIHHEDKILEEPIDITIMKDSLVIFDDCDKIQEKKILKNVMALIADVIACGRKYNIHSVILMHQLMNYRDTRDILNELNKVVFYNNTSRYHITRYLKVYAGLSSDTIKKIMALKSRWSMLSVEHPQYLLHEHGIFMI